MLFSGINVTEWEWWSVFIGLEFNVQMMFFAFCQDYSIDEEAALQAALALSLAEN